MDEKPLQRLIPDTMDTSLAANTRNNERLLTGAISKVQTAQIR